MTNKANFPRFWPRNGGRDEKQSQLANGNDEWGYTPLYRAIRTEEANMPRFLVDESVGGLENDGAEVHGLPLVAYGILGTVTYFSPTRGKAQVDIQTLGHLIRMHGARRHVRAGQRRFFRACRRNHHIVTRYRTQSAWAKAHPTRDTVSGRRSHADGSVPLRFSFYRQDAEFARTISYRPSPGCICRCTRHISYIFRGFV